jgi:hypothetical protein
LATWQYRPTYLPSPLVMDIGMNSEEIGEPMLIYLGFIQGPERRLTFARERQGVALDFKSSRKSR